MDVITQLDEIVNDYALRNRFYYEPVTVERAKMFVKQHRMNTRIRNSVLKLAVATNCPDWDVRIKIIEACAQEIIADHEFGHGLAHFEILEQMGVAIGLDLEEIRTATPLPTTRLAWLCWESLQKNRHWLEGLVSNTVAERVNIGGYGKGRFRELGWTGDQREQWRELFGLNDHQLEFWGMHSEADLEHSNLGWRTVAKYAEDLHMVDAVLEAARTNLLVWEMYLTGIGDAGDRVEISGRAVAGAA
jgi:pyrroloquinoline quinone (PQQ) biosynthesis protein C